MHRIQASRGSFGRFLAISLWVAGLPGAGRAGAADGVLDASFDVDGKQTVAFDLGGNNTDMSYDVAAQDDGNVVASGFAVVATDNADFAFARLLPDGSPDPAFGSSGLATHGFDVGGPGQRHDFATSVAIAPDGRIVACGTVDVGAAPNPHRIGVVRLLEDGSLDPTFAVAANGKPVFDLGGAGDEAAWCEVGVEASGKIVVLGWALNSARTGLLRLDVDGTPDEAFGDGGYYDADCSSFGFADCQLNELVVRDDGVWVAGSADPVGTAPSDLLVGVFTFAGDGGFLYDTYDLSFDGFAAELAFGIGIQSDGRLIVGVTALSDAVGGQSRIGAVRFDPELFALDPAFGVDGWADLDLAVDPDDFQAATGGLVVASDDRIVASGKVETASRIDCMATRAGAGGALDTTFGAVGRTAISHVSSLTDEICYGMALSGGRIVISGYATVGADTEFAFARLTDDLIFADGFEGESTFFWSAKAP